jgi:[ribosomal protein S18]-alanine N-acetyltransferase
MSAVLKQALALRPMQMEDLDAVMAIEPTLYSHPWTRGNFSDSLTSGYSAWVLLQHDTMIGYALMMMVLDEAHLLNISVAKSHQKQGLGRYLLEHMLEMAKRHQAANMFLEVRTSNTTAINLYEHMGFCEMAVRKGYYPAHQGREDAILMGLAL